MEMFALGTKGWHSDFFDNRNSSRRFLIFRDLSEDSFRWRCISPIIDKFRLVTLCHGNQVLNLGIMLQIFPIQLPGIGKYQCLKLMKLDIRNKATLPIIYMGSQCRFKLSDTLIRIFGAGNIGISGEVLR